MMPIGYISGTCTTLKLQKDSFLSATIGFHKPFPTATVPKTS